MWIPVSAVSEFERGADALGYTPLTLLCHWLLVAVDALEQGRGDLLPDWDQPARGQVGETKGYRPTIGPDERERINRVLNSRGLDKTVVARTAVLQFNAAGGDLSRMRWLRLPALAGS